MSLGLLLFGFNTYASLSATTANKIQGTKPYFKIDNVKVTNLNKLLDIKVGSGDNEKTYDITHPYITEIELPVGNHLNSVITKATADNNLRQLSSILTKDNVGDDDGDGGENNDNYTITGGLIATWQGWKNNVPSVITDLTVSPSVCDYDYLTLSITTNPNSMGVKPKIATTFGYPPDSEYEHVTKIYKFKALPDICAVKPSDGTVPIATQLPPTSIWDNTAKTFKVQSDYTKNFPTTGADGLYFDLIVKGSDATTLDWSAASVGGVTVTATATNATTVRIKLAGPKANKITTGAQATTYSGATSKFSILGQKTSTTIVQYDFQIQKWFVHRGTQTAKLAEHASWCTGLGNYQQVKVVDLTTASGTSGGYTSGGTIPTDNMLHPNPNGSVFWRYTEGGLLSEWGNVGAYSGANFSTGYYWVKDVDSHGKALVVVSSTGSTEVPFNALFAYNGLCVSL